MIMEEMDGARTIECLRGRLLAERNATKLARHEAQLMENKMIELENQLRGEMKFKNKAEKKLTLLLSKLQSLNIKYVVEEESENCGSRIAITGSAKDSKEHRLQESDHAGCRSENLVAEVITGSRSETSSCSEDASSTVTTNSKSNVQIGPTEKFPDLASEKAFDADDHLNQRTSELKSSEEENHADNSLAMVSVLQTSSSSEKIDEEPKMRNYSETVDEALNALRHARKEIERSMKRRRMLKVKWTQLILS